MIKAIIFDWHGVLDKTLLVGLMKRLSKVSGIPLGKLKIKLGETTRQYALGNIPEKNFWTYIIKETDITFQQTEELKKYINSVVFNRGLWKLLPKLKRSYKIAILSDCPLEKVTLIRKKTDLNIFDEVLFSSEVHLDKYMPEFFYRLTKTLKVKNEEAFFVDDNEKNTDFARKLGFQVWQFRKTSDFIEMIEHIKNQPFSK